MSGISTAPQRAVARSNADVGSDGLIWISPQQSGELVYIKRKLNEWQALSVTLPHLVHRHIFLQPDLRVGPCPTLARIIRKTHPEQVVFLPVVNQEVRLGWAFRGVHWDCGVKLDDHSSPNGNANCWLLGTQVRGW